MELHSIARHTVEDNSRGIARLGHLENLAPSATVHLGGREEQQALAIVPLPQETQNASTRPLLIEPLAVRLEVRA